MMLEELRNDLNLILDEFQRTQDLSKSIEHFSQIRQKIYERFEKFDTYLPIGNIDEYLKNKLDDNIENVINTYYNDSERVITNNICEILKLIIVYSMHLCFRASNNENLNIGIALSESYIYIEDMLDALNKIGICIDDTQLKAYLENCFNEEINFDTKDKNHFVITETLFNSVDKGICNIPVLVNIKQRI